ncbi:MAG: alkaline phosphatase family protein [Acholeplasmataceae bacterium]|nr:alkaline phosphatase family protein [Acholeplasmataceae bacterium]
MKKYPVQHPDYENSILNVSSTIVQYYGGVNSYKKISIIDEKLKLNKKHVVLMLLDGMGTNILSEHLNPDDFLRKHQKKTISSVYPPTTVAATNAVLAAKSPLETGYLGWVQYFKNENTQCVVFLNHDFYQPERVFQELLRDKYLSYETIYNQIKKASPQVKTYELFPSFRENGYASFSAQLEALSIIINQEEQNFTYVYWTDPDMTEHDFGISSHETKEVLKALNDQLTTFSKTMNDDTLMIVIADHGLVDVEGIDLFLDEEIESMYLRKPSIEPRSTNFFIKPNMKKQFEIHFQQKYGHAFKLFSKDELIQSNLLGYGKMHPMTNECLGDYVAIATNKYMFNMKEKSKFKAHHAGLTQGEMEVPLIIFHK